MCTKTNMSFDFYILSPALYPLLLNNARESCYTVELKFKQIKSHLLRMKKRPEWINVEFGLNYYYYRYIIIAVLYYNT